MSFQPAPGHFVLIPAQVMAEFVQVSEPHLVAEDGFVAVGQIPEVFEEKEDLRRQGHAIALELAAVLRPDKQAQEVRFQAFGLESRIGVPGFGVNRNSPGLFSAFG